MSWVIYHAFEQRRRLAKKQELKLAEAVASDNPIAVKKLLDIGVDPNVKIVGQNCEPIIFLSFEKNWFTLPLSKGDRARQSYRITAKPECLRLLLEYGADPNLRDSLGRTALEIAILWCMSEIAKLLLIHGADPNLRDTKGRTPLIKAAILGIQDARPMQYKLKTMMYLLDSGAEIDAQTADGKTALMHAVGHSRLEVVKFLVNSGASVTISDRQGDQAKDVISRSLTTQQQQYLRQILKQSQLDLRKYEYREYIPEGDRQLASIIEGENIKERDFNQMPRRFEN